MARLIAKVEPKVLVCLDLRCRRGKKENEQSRREDRDEGLVYLFIGIPIYWKEEDFVQCRDQASD